MRERIEPAFDLCAVLGERPQPAVLRRLRLGGAALRRVVELAIANQMRGALWLALCRHGVLAPLPDAVRARLPENHAVRVLEEGWRCDRGRAGLMEAAALGLAEALGAQGIEAMFLKGMALVLGGQAGEAGTRWMVDIDLLVQAPCVDRAVETLRALGYQGGGPGHAPHHLEPMALPGGLWAAEIHFAPVEPVLAPALPADSMWRDSVPCMADGVGFRVPGPEDALLHNALHAQESEFVYALCQIPFRRLADFARIAAAAGDGVDWEALRARAARAARAAAFEAHLYQAHRLFGLPWMLKRPPSPRVRLHWALCLAVLAWPWPVARLLLTRVELRRIFGNAAIGRSRVGALSAGLRLAFRLAMKYRWRLLARLAGPR